jgi:hypothetical protein
VTAKACQPSLDAKLVRELASLAKAHAEGHFGDQLTFVVKPKLLIVDELGYLPLEHATANLFFQLVAKRYERGSILRTTNQQVTEWGHVFGDETIAAATLDRLLRHSHTMVIKGESYRLKAKKRAGFGPRSLNIQATYFWCRDRTTSWCRLSAIALRRVRGHRERRIGRSTIAA